MSAGVACAATCHWLGPTLSTGSSFTMAGGVPRGSGRVRQLDAAAGVLCSAVPVQFVCTAAARAASARARRCAHGGAARLAWALLGRWRVE